MTYVGDFLAGSTVRFAWGSYNASGASVTRATNGTVSVYRDSDLTQSTAGVTDTEDFDALTGIHWVAIDTATDATFYTAGHDYTVVVSGATIDGQAVNAVIGRFSILNRIAPANFNALAITAGGAVTVATNLDKDDYTVSGAVPDLDTLQNNLETYIDANAASLPVESGTAQAGTATTITLATGANSTTADYYVGSTIYIVGGTGALQPGRRITDYDQTTRVATVNEAFRVTPDNTSQYKILPGGDYTIAEVQAGLATQASVDTVDGVVDAILAAVNALNDLDAATVKAQVVAALTTDLYPELAAVPAANAPLADKITLLAMAVRNGMAQTDDSATLLDDNGLPLMQSAVADDGTTFTSGKLTDAA